MYHCKCIPTTALKADKSKAEYVFCGLILPLASFEVFSSYILGIFFGIMYMKQRNIRNCAKGYIGLQHTH